MLKYGEKFDSYTADYSELYDSINRFFDSPNMVLLKKENGFDMYGTKLKCMINKQRYIFALIPGNDANRKEGDMCNLTNIEWAAFHIRELEDGYNLDEHEYKPKRLEYLNKNINRTELLENKSVYNVDNLEGVRIILLHKKDGGMYQYQPTGQLMNVLQTFNTIISINV